MYVNYEHACTPDQYKVVCQHEGPILCVACPGSGKTHTLVHRTAHMIQHGIDPESILLVSFTRKASHEITDRIARLIGPDARGIWAGTFHSIALRLLRKHYTLLGFETEFSVMSQGDMTDLMRLIRVEAKELKEWSGCDTRIKLPNVNDLLSFFSAVRNQYKDMKEQVEKEHAGYEDAILWMYDEYVARKRYMCLMDYDDLLFGLRYMLESKPALRAMYSQKFTYLMVDEFQDTNPVQNDIVLMLTDQHDNLMVVGDEAQSIYGFRGAEISNILSITGHFPTMTVMRLEENHRSNQHIVQLLNTTLEYAIEKIDKSMRSVIDNEDSLPPVVYASRSGIEQAQYVIGMINKLHHAGVPYHEIAVLFRNSYHANMIDMLLAQQGVPFVRWGGIKFTEAAHILDVLAFFKIRVNQFDKISWRRVLTMIPGVGPGVARKVIETIMSQRDDENGSNPFALSSILTHHSQPSWEALRDFQGKSKYTPALQILGSFLTNLNVHKDVEEVFDLIWEYYEPFCRKMYTKDFEFRQYGILQLREIASQYTTVTEFLDEFVTEETSLDGDDQPLEDKLVLSTIHSAKGCEWQHVFVIELVEGALPSYRNPDDEEELRLFYVACSRAKNGLYLIFPKERKVPDGRTERTIQSRFLRRALNVCIP